MVDIVIIVHASARVTGEQTVPESRHRRKGKIRPRPKDATGPPKKPDPSPAWVPVSGVGLILLGVVVIIINYLPGLLRNNIYLLVGFGLMAVGFGFLTRWR